MLKSRWYAAAITAGAVIGLASAAETLPPDPQQELRRLSQGDAQKIDAKCASADMGIFRKCVWRELEKLRLAPADPRPELRKLSIGDSGRIKIKCDSADIGEYRSCVWRELGKLRLAPADPRPAFRKLSVVDSGRIKVRCYSTDVGSFRRCVWGELDKLRLAPTDPQPELRKLAFAEARWLRTKCYATDVGDYRRCVWRELERLGVQPREPAAPGPERPSPRNPVEVAAVQELLQRLGYDPGPVDGFAGPKTSAALERFQRDKGLSMTGDPYDQPTRRALEAALAALRRDPGPQPAPDR